MYTLSLLQQPHFHVSSHVTQVCCCCFSPDGSGSEDNMMNLWITRDGSLINTLGEHTDIVTTTSLSSWFSCHTGAMLLFLT